MLHFRLMKTLKILFFVLLMPLALPVLATVVPNLYIAQIPVHSQNVNDRSIALSAAYQTVLIKVTANSKVLQNGRIQAAAAHPDEYIQQYSYQANSDATDAANPYLLIVQFDPEAINRLLASAKLVVWGQDRPLTLFWIATTVDGTQHLLSASDEGPIPSLLDKQAQLYGLPILLPILDLNDLSQLSVTDIVGRFVAPVVQASVRYGSNAIVMINIEKKNHQWTSLWTLITTNAPQSWQEQGTDLSQIMSDGMQQLTHLLSQQFALSGGKNQSTTNLQISGINNLNDYAHALRYLQRISLVKKVTVLKLAGTQVQFQLVLRGDRNTLQKAIALDQTLTSITAAPTASTQADSAPATVLAHNLQNNDTGQLEYQWTP